LEQVGSIEAMTSNQSPKDALAQSDTHAPSAPLGNDLLMIRLLMGVYWFDEALQGALKAAGWPPVSRTLSLLFSNLSAGEHRPARLAANLGVSRQSMSQMLAELAARDFVRIEPDPDDRRAKLVTFGDAVLPLRGAALTVLRDLESELRSRIGDTAFAALVEALATDWGEAPPVKAPPAGSA
jgi:DNA-binding MarR family transcriptional regulator